ncbi:MAG TPA: DUF3786 domain-containing protein [Desulfosarcina sp.]|nr:DUF3786 domain-containing protein [Desulfosarcina sp.]
MTAGASESAYADVIRNHLAAAFPEPAVLLGAYPGVAPVDEGFRMTAFGQPCLLSPEGVLLDGRPEWGPMAVLIALLAKHAAPDRPIQTPWRAFRELPDSAPYVGAFRARTEQILVPHIPALHRRRDAVTGRLAGRPPAEEGPGDWSLVVEALPKITLCYHFYLPDEDFPANATCLFSNNAHRFLPTDALADVGEYLSRALIAVLP